MRDRPTTTVVLKYELKDCSKCPMVKCDRTPGWGYAMSYFCTASDNKKISSGVEWDKDHKPVPEWCPCRIEKIYGL